MKKIRPLQDQVSKLITTLSSETDGAKHFLKLCLHLLNSDESPLIAQLAQQLITTESLAYYFAIELKVNYNF